ncbi:hypothetical protein PHISCL_09836 [Aspergillus sclerotialis]|uniref:Uncharacterized protein n=1 Tax=Aspergillus sclerotialis TaxID=2070753 RepID=A0A3A2Z4M2_9EURO|nr:hypothetical protein PHISCL_09836 [Aspergillus sclerotialis]
MGAKFPFGLRQDSTQQAQQAPNEGLPERLMRKAGFYRHPIIYSGRASSGQICKRVVNGSDSA